MATRQESPSTPSQPEPGKVYEYRREVELRFGEEVAPARIESACAHIVLHPPGLHWNGKSWVGEPAPVELDVNGNKLSKDIPLPGVEGTMIISSWARTNGTTFAHHTISVSVRRRP